MKLLYVFNECAPIFIERAWRISLSSASRLLAATILAGAHAGNAMAQAPDAGCALPSEPEGIPAALDEAHGPPTRSVRQHTSDARSRLPSHSLAGGERARP
jgi:hypothetical protein